MKLRLAVLALVALTPIAAATAEPTETRIEATGPAGILRGTLLAPQHPNAAVLIIPGSGPTDRDGNNPMGVNASPYRLLAEALAPAGISTTRIDKRGLFQSAGPGVDPNTVTIPDYVADVAAWTSTVKQRTGARCVWLLGHSEGALIAEVAAQTNRDVCGLILVAGAGRRLGDVLREQFRSNPANTPLLAASDHIISELEAGRRVDASTIPAPLMALFRPQVQGFLISMFSYDPQELLRSYAGPVLVLQGTSDLQVSMTDAEALHSARAGITLVRLEGVNHVLKVAPANDRAANIATYADPSLPLAPGVAEAIGSFVASH